ncbi:MAG: AbrB/MazE/SpoVT family DNA-binding domain-containing protein [Candidatus Aenigmarchaeota archaeon]|nr:AbrB/MazE/SpoVT family DNA-binding domain-containing protein [Candidatus Aenigmarchaeota archaeon]
MQLTFTKLDAKGRISIPAHVRNSVGIRNGDRVAFVTKDSKEITILPSISDSTATLTAIMSDHHKGMTRIINILNSHRISVISMESFTLERNEKFECNFVVGLEGYSDIDALKKEIKDGSIEDIEITSN